MILIIFKNDFPDWTDHSTPSLSIRIQVVTLSMASF